MGWEMRRGKRVYYRKVREGGSVRSVYCGSGERGEAAAREDAARRAGAGVAHAPQADDPAACVTPAPPCATETTRPSAAEFTVTTGAPVAPAVVATPPATRHSAPPLSTLGPCRHGTPPAPAPRPPYAPPAMSPRAAVSRVECLLAINPRRTDLGRVIADLDADDQTRCHLRWKYLRNRP